MYTFLYEIENVRGDVVKILGADQFCFSTHQSLKCFKNKELIVDLEIKYYQPSEILINNGKLYILLRMV